MIYVSVQTIKDIVQFAEDTLAKENLVHSGNGQITTHKEAKWIVNKLKYVIGWIESLSEITSEEVKYPITEGVMSSIHMIKNIQRGVQ